MTSDPGLQKNCRINWRYNAASGDLAFKQSDWYRYQNFAKTKQVLIFPCKFFFLSVGLWILILRHGSQVQCTLFEKTPITLNGSL